jgi:excisionase family DNA binding protein
LDHGLLRDIRFSEAAFHKGSHILNEADVCGKGALGETLRVRGHKLQAYNRETIRRWVSDDRIAYVEVGKKYIISKDELRSFLRCKFFGNITRKSAVHLRLVAYSCANAYKQEKGSEN